MLAVEVFEITIKKIPYAPDSFKRRVSEKYITARNKKGLYPVIIIPDNYNNKVLNVNYNQKVLSMDTNLEGKIIKGFKQKARKRRIIPAKSRNYYNEYEWIHGTSPEGLYTTIICPEELIGKVVTVMTL